MNKLKLIKISCMAGRELTGHLSAELKKLGIYNFFIQPARSSVLKEKKIIIDYRTSTLLEDKRTDFFKFYIPAKYEKAVISVLAESLKLNQPGRGSIFSEEVTVWGLPENSYDEAILKNLKAPRIQILKDIMGISCIVQRGEGNILSRAVLERGISVPVITYGTGMGLRDRLGLLRITIARDKDIIFLTANRHDAAEAMNMMIETARLDYPGKGFIYMHPLRIGVLDTRIYKGTSMHVASMEQMINAIDELKKSTDWRRKSASFISSRNSSKWNLLSRLVNCTLICNEGESEYFIKQAMDNGAGGATLSKLQCVLKQPSDITLRQAPSAKEKSDLIINEETADRLLKLFANSNYFSSDVSGLIELSRVDRASTYA